MWIEKYRPKTLDNVIGNKNNITIIKKYVKRKNIPNMIMYGSAGTGKTSTAIAMCRELYGKLYDENVIELNASDERGINVVREKIKLIAKSLVSDSVSYKIIILDEVDSMTAESMTALRNIIDQYSKITHFCLICNHIYKIADGLLSRCVHFHFKTLSTEDVCFNLKKIYAIEHMTRKIPKTVVDKINDITKYTNGDMRKSVMLLQYSKYTNKINELAGFSTDGYIQKIYKQIKAGYVLDAINEIIYSGIMIQNFLIQLLICIVNDKSLIQQRGLLLNTLSETDFLIANGCSDYINLLRVFMTISNKKT